ncbi:S8 family serine peptidase [Streptomyces luteireticuli]|uniref:S8 family serine peptidase n=1 Tax=Streptomyces luteireticuli TaxID=173858 RepID=UPI003558E187
MRRGTHLARNARSVALHCAAALFLLASTATSAHADTVRERQWHLEGMHAEEMWRTSDGAGVTVAVLDSRVDADLPDLQGQVLPEKDFSESAAPEDVPGHGTAMAVLIAGTGKGLGGTGAKGLAPGAKILPVRVDDPIGSDRSLVRAIRFAADSNAKIINVSIGYAFESKEQAQALDYAAAKGKLVFASAGNEGQKGNPAEYPAAHKGVVGVGAIDRNARVTAESQRGRQVVLAAPGDDMYTTTRQGTGIRRSHGTSDASALASASAALLWSAHPNWTANQVLRVLINTAGGPKSGEKRNDTLGYGVVRPRIALKSPGDPGPAEVNPLLGTSLPKSSESKRPEAQKQAGQKPEAAPEKASEDNTPSAWIGAAVGAFAVLAAAITIPFTVARRRRNRATAFGPPPPPYGSYNSDSR